MNSDTKTSKNPAGYGMVLSVLRGRLPCPSLNNVIWEARSVRRSA